MRRWAFVIAVLGMLVLLGYFVFDVREVDSLEGLEINQRVILGGEVVGEENSYGRRVFKLGNGIELVCEGCGDFVGGEIVVEGIVLENGRVEVLEIRTND